MVLKHPGEQCEFSRVLPEIYKKVPEGDITLKEFLKLMGDQGKLIISMLLAAPFLIPIYIPGTGIIAGLIIFTLIISIIFNRDLIPNRFQKKKISHKNLIKALDISSRVFNYIERFVKPRLLVMTTGLITPKVNKFFLLLSTLLFMFPLPVPLTNTLPAFGVFLLAAGTLECDGYLILAGYGAVIITIIYFGSVILLGWAGISAGLSYFG
ncbi:MAG: exopolysaccharide biosynthesis protein [Methanobacterium sp.]|nr:exopolysaccharide biosynthesis protein [Methanobacterium sp.]